MSLTASRAVAVAYATLAYAAFVATTVWAVVFLIRPVDDGPASPGRPAALVDIALLGLFAIQHTVMARSGFKRWLVRIVPAGAERSTYVLASSLVLGLLFWQWRPISATVWHTTTQPWTDLVWTVYACGWLIAIAATFMLDHADFLGLKQAYQQHYREQPFRERWLYVWVRHPMMLGLMIAFWATPEMTAGHVLFAAAATGYIAIGVRFEERDLRRQLGGEYDAYATRVPALLPRIGRRIEPGTAPVEAHPRGQQSD